MTTKQPREKVRTTDPEWCKRNGRKYLPEGYGHAHDGTVVNFAYTEEFLKRQKPVWPIGMPRIF